jgi:UDP-N-acetylmuramoylalanine--D-glutamate ligase
MKILILGLGVSGRAAAAFLLKQGHPVIASDKRAEEIRSHPEVAALLQQGLVLGGEDVSLEGVSQIVLSPGVPSTHPVVQKARGKNIEVIGEIELAMRHIENRCIGITGTNGKTTTVLLTTHLLMAAGIKARALGNVGVGLSSYLLHPDPEEILVIELSSFQLETLQARRLDLAVVLNLTPNHLDWHPTMADYAAAKLSIQKCVKPGGKLLVSKQVASEFGALLQEYALYDETVPAAFAIVKEFGVYRAPSGLTCSDRLRLCAIDSPRRSSLSENGAPRSNQLRFVSHGQNTSILPTRGIEDLEKGLATFRKPPHRIEWVADICGVAYYNDSKSSNVHSVIYAVAQLDGPIVLIAGGTDKGSSYVPWIDGFKGKVKRIVAYGLAAAKMEKELSRDFPFEKRGPFRDAVIAAHDAAVEKDTVLLSPGCSSFDQFRNYEHRGDVFKQIVREEWIEKKQF